MLRVDAHVHAFPDRLALAVRERLNQRGGLEGSPLLAGVAERVRDAGFDRAWILPYAHRAGVAESINEWSADQVGAIPWLVAGATFHPGDEDPPRLVERALVALRLRVVKLHCSVGGFSPADERLEPLWETAEAVGVPVVVHAGQLNPGETSGKEVDELRAVLDRHHRLPLVLAHTGYPATDRALALMSEYENLFGDLTPVWDRPQTITADDIMRFPGRFLFGSDSPNNPVGAGEQARRYEDMGLPAEDLALLLGGAAMQLVPAGEE
ncbi:MAG: amidohydrolase family protein [Dehalococcoidia bacterium]